MLRGRHRRRSTVLAHQRSYSLFASPSITESAHPLIHHPASHPVARPAAAVVYCLLFPHRMDATSPQAGDVQGRQPQIPPPFLSLGRRYLRGSPEKPLDGPGRERGRLPPAAGWGNWNNGYNRDALGYDS